MSSGSREEHQPPSDQLIAPTGFQSVSVDVGQSGPEGTVGLSRCGEASGIQGSHWSLQKGEEPPGRLIHFQTSG